MTTFTASGTSSPWAVDTALARGGDGYFAWLDHIWPAAGCTHPIRLHGDLRIIDPAPANCCARSPPSACPTG